MSQRPAIEAVFENGVFRPLVEVKLAEHQRVSLVINVPEDDLPADILARVAESGSSFAFLANQAEDIYSPDDGESV